MSRQDRITRRFQAAATTYDQAARTQGRIAQALADAIAQDVAAEGGRVLELGCGTGALARRLLGRLKPALWIASDIAPAMLAQARQDLGGPALAFACLDAANPCLTGGFDLVCSSLTLQWLDDPAAAIQRWTALVKPGGVLGFSTLLDGSFGEWRGALAAAGAPEPGPAMPTLAELRGWLNPHARIGALDVVVRHGDGLSFLKAARLTGVDVTFGRALNAGTMRRAINVFQRSGAEITYRAALVAFRV